MGKLYVYSTKTLMYPRTIHTPDGDVNYNSWFKIGMTEQDQVEVRVKQQDGTSNPESLIIQQIFEQNYFDLEPYDISAYEAEQHIHEYFRNKGKEVRLDASREWFECSMDEVRQSIQHIVDPEAHKLTLKLMPHQDEAYKFITDKFESGSKQILLNHKPRSGKTFIVYNYLLQNKPANVLVLTNFPVLNNQWINDAKRIKGLDYDFINMSTDTPNEITLNDDIPNFVMMSFQDSKGGIEIFEKKKFDLLKKIKWDLLIIDEIHKGKETAKTDILLEKIEFDKLIGLSATPTKNLLRGTFTKDDTHVYNLVDEAKFKKQYPDIYTLPDISYWMYNVPDSVRKELKFYSEDDQFTWAKFCSVKDGRLVYKNDLRIFFMWIAGYYGGGINSPLKKFDANSILLFVQNNECQDLIVELLNEIPFYKENYNIHFTNSNVSGNSNKLLEKTKTTFIPRDGKKCIIIANGQLTTGITLKYCDMVMFMNDWASIDEYIQASFRCQSPMAGKKTCQVIDFTPYRTFTILNRHIENNTIFNGKSLDSNRSEFLNSVTLFESCDAGFKEIDLQAFKERVVDAMDINDKNFFGNYLINKDAVANDRNWLYDKLGRIESGSDSAETKERLDDNGIEKGKTKQTLGEKKDKKESDEGDKKLLWALENIEYFLGKAPLLSICCDYKRDNLDDCLDYIHSDIKREKSFVDFLSLDSQLNIDFATADLIYRNYINVELLNDRILTVNIKFRGLIYTENKSLRVINIEKVLGLIESYVGVSKIEKKLLAEVFTPFSLAEEILEKTYPDSDWTNPNLKWFGPSAGCGNFQIVIVKKLMKGLELWQPDEEKRYKHIIENQIYVNEYQPKNMFIYLQLFDPNHEYKMNWNRGDYMTFNFEKKWGCLPDRIIENPPYNAGNKKNFYVDFFMKSLDLVKKDGIISFITPSRYVIQPEFEKLRNKIEKLSNKVILKNTGRIFGDGASFSTVYTTIHMGDGSKVNWIDGIGDVIVDKVINSNFPRLNTFRSKALLKNKEEVNKFTDVPDINKWKYFVNSKGGNKTPFRYVDFYVEDTFKPKIAMTEFVGTNDKKSLGNLYIDYTGDWGIATDSTMVIYNDSPKILDKLNFYLSSPLIKYLLTKICQSSHANQTMRLLPDITESLSDNFNLNELYSLFNFTEDEIKKIEK